MTNQVHAHDVMEMMMASGKDYTRDGLRQAIFERFGSETRFCACSADDMTADELIDFMAERGKFREAPGGLSLDPTQQCDH